MGRHHARRYFDLLAQERIGRKPFTLVVPAIRNPVGFDRVAGARCILDNPKIYGCPVARRGADRCPFHGYSLLQGSRLQWYAGPFLKASGETLWPDVCWWQRALLCRSATLVPHQRFPVTRRFGFSDPHVSVHVFPLCPGISHYLRRCGRAMSIDHYGGRVSAKVADMSAPRCRLPRVSYHNRSNSSALRCAIFSLSSSLIGNCSRNSRAPVLVR